ncbi:hypothetical protein R6G99_04015, partial [Actinotignum timonense]|nr:hypothetical protein [Actinotignum timonense]
GAISMRLRTSAPSGRTLRLIRPMLAPLLEFCRHPRRAADLAFRTGDDVPGTMLGFIDPGFNPVRDLKLVVDYLRTGGPKVLASKVKSRLRKYL